MESFRSQHVLSFDFVRRLDESELGTCLHFPVSRYRNQRIPMVALFVLFLLPSTVQLEDVSQHNGL